MALLHKLKDYGFRRREQSFTDTDYLVMASFFPEAEPRTPPEVLERTGFSYETVHSILNKLSEGGALDKKMVGRTQQFTLNTHTTQAFMAYMLYQSYKQIDFMERQKPIGLMLKRLADKTKPLLLMVYGSYAKFEQRKDSDIDLIIVDGKFRHESQKLPDHKIEVGAMESQYGLRIHPIVFEYMDFLHVAKHNPSLWNSLKTEGIAYEGWNEAFNAFYT